MKRTEKASHENRAGHSSGHRAFRAECARYKELSLIRPAKALNW
ncbi:hypothetical protein CEV32_1530 [Brucella rhizosphaerae]|uniref:Uncharacterized protein n=1 Tax=Brucella rhizosphaerae TaxID=571254 RepID=A0A256F8R9_9HYPH|nr:hypothetical protein CEV32_1530 [Brucella rhizosphaerae]